MGGVQQGVRKSVPLNAKQDMPLTIFSMRKDLTGAIEMRWYPWGIQPLVSTYFNCHWGEGFGVRSVLDSGKKIRVFNFVGGGGVLGKVSFGLWKEN